MKYDYRPPRTADFNTDAVWLGDGPATVRIEMRTIAHLRPERVMGALLGVPLPDDGEITDIRITCDEAGRLLVVARTAIPEIFTNYDGGREHMWAWVYADEGWSLVESPDERFPRVEDLEVAED